MKSILAKWTVKDGQHRVYGAAWGADVARVEVNIDGGSWIEAVIDEGMDERWAWKFWHHDWNDLGPGEHEVTSRAIDKKGNIQPTSDDAVIMTKRTYWEANAQVTRTVRI